MARNSQLANGCGQFPPNAAQFLAVSVQFQGEMSNDWGVRGMGRALGSAVSGVLVGVMAVVFATSYSSIIFAGELAPYVHVGIGITLLSSALMAVIIALASSYAGSVALPQDIGSAVFAIAAASIAAEFATRSDPQNLVPTVIVALILTSVVTGILLLSLGVFRLGGLVRYIPYPVIGGFLAASGWLLLGAALSLMSGLDVTLQTLPKYIASPHLGSWLPGILLAVILLSVTRIVRHPLVLPGCMILVILLFQIFLSATGISRSDAQDMDLVLTGLPDGNLWPPLGLDLFYQADWSVVFAQASTIGTIALLSAIGMLLNVSAIEVTANRDMNIDRELNAVGAANLMCSAAGGMTGFHYLSLTSLSYRIGGTSRAVGLLAAGICLGALFYGGGLLAGIPKMLLGAVIAFLGMEFMIEWLVKSRQKLPLGDYLVIVLIFIVAGAIGFLEAVGVGILASSVLFLVNYSRLGVVRHQLSGADYHSNVARSESEMKILRGSGDCILLLKLNGYVFFGTANNVVEVVQGRCSNPDRPLRFIVLDFDAVTGVDSSAALSLTKLHQLCLQNGWTLALTGLSQTIRDRLQACGFDLANLQRARMFPELDRGLEWCESQIVGRGGNIGETRSGPLSQLRKEFPTPDLVDELMQYLEEIIAEPDQRLIVQGDDTRDMYFIDDGKVSVELEVENRSNSRLLTTDHGTVGEVGFYTDLPRSATVFAETRSSVYRLSRESLSILEQENPRLASALHAYIARRLGYRLADTSRVLRAVLR